MRSKLWMFVALLAIITMLAGCATETPGPSTPEPETPQTQATEVPAADEDVTLNIGIASDADTLNVLVSNEINTSLMLNATYPLLFQLDKDGQKQPYIIDEPFVSEDGLTMRVTVKDDLFWTDGTPITAHDLVWTYDAVLEGKFHWTYTVLDGITWEALDDKTVEFTLSQPFPKFLSQIGAWVRIVPSHVWSAAENVEEFLDEDFVGFGPFRMVEYKTGEYYLMERVEGFPFAPTDDKAYVDTLVFKPYPDPNTMLLALKTGDVDVAARPLTSEAAADLADSDDVSLAETIDLGYEHLHFNLTNELLSDVAIRKAIAMSIDRSKLVNFGYGGNAEPMMGATSPLYTQFDFGITYPEFDIEGAKAVLADAGYEDTDDDGIVNAPSGENLSFELIYAVNYTEHEKLATVIAEDAAQAGIELVAKGLDKPVQLEQLYTDDDGNNTYEISINTWGIIDDVEASASDLFLPESGLNWMHWVNDDAVQAMMAMRSGTTTEVVNENMKIFQTAITTDMPDIPLVVKGNVFAYRNEFAGFEVVPDDLKGLVTPQNLWSVYKVQ